MLMSNPGCLRKTRSRCILFRLLVGLLAASVTPMAAEENEASLDSVKTALENILAKEGISIGGVFRGEYLHSSIGGEGIVTPKNTEESAEYTSVDFDIRARPNTVTQGRLVFRMHQDWRNFFSDISNPIVTRWISIDGSVKDMFSYNVGDFRQRYSPLTLWAPDIDLLYEPEIFEQKRERVMAEEFLGDNDRLLQGVNLNMDAEVVDLFDEFHLNLLGSRLRNVETSIQDGSLVTSAIEESLIEKYLGAANLDLRFGKAFDLGGSYLKIWDRKGTYAGPGRADSAAQDTDIFGIRAGVALDRLLDAQDWDLHAGAEYAQSDGDSTWFGSDSSWRNNDGSALRAAIDAEYRMSDAFTGRLKLTYLKNDRDFRNELAQSPTFVPRRIMNIENDTAFARDVGVNNMHYSFYDAAYHQVFKFTPSEATNLWVKAPFQKISYSNAILTREEMTELTLDPAVQLVMPHGPATANRTGLQAHFETDLVNDAIELQLLGAQLQEVTADQDSTGASLPKTKYQQVGGGFQVNVEKFLAYQHPLRLQTGFVRSSAVNDGNSREPEAKVVSDLINGGAYLKFHKRAALMLGLQQAVIRNTMAAMELTETQRAIGGGIEYRIAAGSYAALTLTRLDVTHEGDYPAGMDFYQLYTNLGIFVNF